MAPLQEGGGSPEPSPAASERLAQPGVVTAEAIVAALEAKEKRDAENEERARAARRQAEEEEEISECVAGAIAWTRGQIQENRKSALGWALFSIAYFVFLLLLSDVAWWAYLILGGGVVGVKSAWDGASSSNKELRRFIKAQGSPEKERALIKEWFSEDKVPSDWEWLE